LKDKLFIHPDSFKINPKPNSGYKQKACHNFCSLPGQFHRETKLISVYQFRDSGSGQFLHLDKFIFRRDLQKLRHGVLPAGIVYWLKYLDRWPAGLRHQRFLLIPATVVFNCSRTAHLAILNKIETVYS